MLLSSCLRLSRRSWRPLGPKAWPIGPQSCHVSKLRFLPASWSRMVSGHHDIKKYSVKSQAKENILTVPNGLCVFRIAATPYLAHLVLHNDLDYAFGLFALAGFTDLLDGWIARNFEGQASMLGSFLDPLADKILVATLYLSLTYVGLIPVELTSLVVSRDVLLVYAGLYIRYMGVTPPFTLKKYFDLSLPSAQVQPTMISKLNTMVQLGLVASAMIAPRFDMVDHPAFQGLCLLTATTTFASAVSYAFMKDTYRFSQRSYDHQFGKKLVAFIIFILFNVGFVSLMPKQPKAVDQESK
ncbi:hypothetical protein TCAL_01569 [Tigriopus californicus]|uniref:cardiolipin synthase (CMP-forming) n=1 Tax=Tigriopus californicus TaxID=6832 RepID=A0A553P8G7_TIGCA|nr:probable cardiolipin synthase (CMP-forming) [Tigriopus californicus]TRY73981.1 hypothetical protein TCAL_01569 [Tigriopus californicus]